MRVSSSQIASDSYGLAGYLKEMSGQLYDVAFTIHVPTCQVRDMDGAKLRFHSLPHIISTIEGLEKVLGAAQFHRLSNLLKWCSRSYGNVPVHNAPPYEVITLLDMPGADCEASYIVKIVPFGATPDGDNEWFLVLLSETLPSSADRDWAIAAHDGGRTFDNLLLQDSSWQFESHLDISYRQREELRLTAIGYTISMIADRLRVGDSSLKKSRNRIMKLLHAPTTASAIRTASILGLLNPSRL